MSTTEQRPDTDTDSPRRGRRLRTRRPGAAAVAESGAVDLGPASEVVTGSSLALRDLAEHGQHEAGTAEPEPAPTRNPLRRLGREVRAYGELRQTPYGLKPALIIAAIGFFQTFDSYAFTAAGPEIARALELNVFDIISVQVIVGGVAIFAAIGVGYLADRTRRVPFLAIGTLLSGIFSIFSSRATSFGSLATPRVLDDVADEASGVPQFSLLADYYPPDARGRVFSLLGTVSRAAQILALVAVGFLVTTVGFRTTFVICGAPLVVLGVVALLQLREPVRGYMERKALGATDDVANQANDPQSLGESWRAVTGVRTIKRLLVSSTIGAIGDTAVGIFFPYFLAERYGLDSFERSLLILPSVAFALVGGIYGGGLIDRFLKRNPSRVLTITAVYSAIASLGILTYAFEPPLVLLGGASAVLGFGGALIGPARSVITANVIPPNIRTTGLQIYGLSALPALLLAASIGGLIQGRYGYDALFLAAFPFLIISALIDLTVAPFYELDMRSALASSIADEEWRQAQAAGKGKMLVCRDIEVEYSGVKVLFGVDFDVEEGEIIALLGTNGAGKSTLLRAISGLTQASNGAVVFDGRDVTAMPAHETAARGIVFMPGGRGVFPNLTVRDNLLLGSWLSDEPRGIEARLAETYAVFPVLEERIGTLAGQLSGGEQQQLSLAQAFLCRPRLLLIDELSLGLSPVVVGQLLEVVRRIRDTGVTIVVVEQSVNVALNLAEKAVFMEKGEVKFFGATKDLLERPDILRAVYVKGTGALTDGAPAAARRNARDARLAALGDAPPVLEVEGLVKRYGGLRAVDEASFALRDGEVLGLIGPNGAGKTTIFDLISGYQVPDEGVVRYEGVDITRSSPEERARRKLVRRFQDARLFPSLTVNEALLVSLEQRLDVRSPFLAAIGSPQSRRAEKRLQVRADRLLELLDLGTYKDTFVRELSTGLRRIVDLACVLGAEPKVLLLDEPSSGIAQAEAEGLAPLLRRVRFETGCSILIIEHDMPLISAVSDELIALEQGRVITRGLPDEVLNDERVVESYLGTTEAAINRSGSPQ